MCFVENIGESLLFRPTPLVKMKFRNDTPHLDPLPSSDEGRGNTDASNGLKRVGVSEDVAFFPLPIGWGEDQGEGLLRQTFVSFTKLIGHRNREGNISKIRCFLQSMLDVQIWRY